MATIGDVAKKAGVSTTLVSRYLNQVKGVGPASKEKIEAAIRELNYVPDESARMLVRRRGGGNVEAVSGSLPDTAGTPSEGGTEQVRMLSVAMLCEDVDAQIASALYLGARHAIWEEESLRAYHLIKLSVLTEHTDGISYDDMAEDEKETFAYVSRFCRGVMCVCRRGGMMDTAMRVNENSSSPLSVPTTLVCPAPGSKVLRRGTAEFRAETETLEKAGARFIRILCENIANGELTLDDERISCMLTVEEPQGGGHTGIGSSLQSHLL